MKRDEAPREGRGSSLWTNNRERVYMFLTFRPFSTRKDISLAVDISDKTAAWHISKLYSSGFVTSVNRLYYPTGFVSKDDVQVALALSNGDQRNAFNCVLRNPGINLKSVAQEEDISMSRMSSLSKNLEEVGLITRVKDGRVLRMYATSLLEEKIDEYRKRGPGFVEHVSRLISQEGIRFDPGKRGETFTATLKEGSSRYSLVINTNPFRTLAQKEVSVPF